MCREATEIGKERDILKAHLQSFRIWGKFFKIKGKILTHIWRNFQIVLLILIPRCTVLFVIIDYDLK